MGVSPIRHGHLLHQDVLGAGVAERIQTGFARGHSENGQYQSPSSAKVHVMADLPTSDAGSPLAY